MLLFLPDVDEREVQDLIKPFGKEFLIPGTEFMTGFEPVVPGFVIAFRLQDRDVAPVPAFLFQQGFPPADRFEAQGIVAFRPGFKERAHFPLRFLPETGHGNHHTAAPADKGQDFVREDPFFTSEVMVGIHADNGVKPVLREGHIQRVAVDRDDPVFQGKIPDPPEIVRRVDPEVEGVHGFRGGFVRQENGGAIRNGADELDMVINLSMVKDGCWDDVKNDILAVRKACKEKVLKVIIECCLLTEQEKIRLCEIVSECGADYIKTSTGFSKGGATPDDVRLMREHCPESVKVKAAGGISSLEDAEEFLALGAERLGTSRIVKIAMTQDMSDNV